MLGLCGHCTAPLRIRRLAIQVPDRPRTASAEHHHPSIARRGKGLFIRGAVSGSDDHGDGNAWTVPGGTVYFPR